MTTNHNSVIKCPKVSNEALTFFFIRDVSEMKVCIISTQDS
jgi:hypothetical protein